jgi:hypothetical protein
VEDKALLDLDQEFPDDENEQPEIEPDEEPEEEPEVLEEPEKPEDSQEEKPENKEPEIPEQMVPVHKVAKLRQRAQKAEKTVEKLTQELDDLSGQSPLEKWVEENPDEETVPARIQVAERKHERRMEQLRQDKQQATKEVQPFKEYQEDRMSAIESNREVRTLMEFANEHMTDEEAGRLGASILGADTDEKALDYARRYCSAVIAKRGDDVSKSVLAVMGSKSSKASKKVIKKTTVETQDVDEDDYSPLAGFMD